MEIYTEMQEITDRLSARMLTVDDVMAYQKLVHRARWVFGDEVIRYLHTEYQPRLVEFSMLTGELEDADTAEQKKAIKAKRLPIGTWFLQHGHELDRYLEPYLRIGL